MNDEKIMEFFKKVDSLSAGERAALKRSVGVMLSKADGSAFSLFYQILPYGVRRNDEDIYFVAACLRCLWKPDEAATAALQGAAGKYMHSSNAAEGFRKRLTTLMDTKWDDSGYLAEKLLKIVRFLKQQGYVIKADELLYDVLHWNSEDRYIQKKWAREMFVIIPKNETDEGEDQ